MDEEFAAISPRLVQTGNLVRVSPDSLWGRVTAIRPGQIAIGRAEKGHDTHGSPSIGRAEVEPAVILSLGGGDEINQPHSELIEVRTEKVHAAEIGRPDVIEIPDSDVWASVRGILIGESGSNPTSATRFFTCIDEFGGERKFDSYFQAATDQPSRLRNESIRRVVRE